MSAPTDICLIGQITDDNRVQLGFTTGTGDLQEVVEWDNEPIQNGSTAEEYSEDHTLLLNIHKFFINKWALFCKVNELPT